MERSDGNHFVSGSKLVDLQSTHAVRYTAPLPC